jgi:ATP-dependent DNA helicase RecG
VDGTIRFKKAAVLLFSEDPSVFIPSAEVRYIRYAGSEQRSGSEFNVIKDEFFRGPIPSLIRELESFMEGSLRDYYFLNLETGQFQRIAEYPKEAWFEGIVNALCHRSYNVQGNPITLKHFDDRLVIANSGPLPAQVTVENIRHERYSRNPLIARVLYELGYIRELNEGVPRIFDAMSRNFLAEPIYRDENDQVSLTLINKVASHRETIPAWVLGRVETAWPELNPSQRKILHCIFLTLSPNLRAIRDYCALSEGAVRYNLNALIDKGLIIKDSEKIRDKDAPYRLAEH